MPPRPDTHAFAAGLRWLQIALIVLIGIAVPVTVFGLVRLGVLTTIACLVVLTIAVERLRVFVASMGNRR